ncbi:MAG: hypothetical protein O7F73_08710 [Gammaproteobacteria bacterium]|nr:hypothetical protein [Gammaproteobacteria bacterium]
MASAFLEIVELANGDIVLQRAEDEGEPLVVIRFSEESRVYLFDATLEVARVMIQAGMQAAASMAEQGELELEQYEDGQSRILH